MAEQKQVDHDEIKRLTSQVVEAYVAHHTVALSELPKLITTVGRELAGLGKAPAEIEEKPKPFVPIKRSVRKEVIVCLVCGKAQKMLKRHLVARHELTPEAYRAMFDLKADYPLVAPAYAATRSALAKEFGLGRKPEPIVPKKTPQKRPAKKAPAKTN